MKDFLERYLLPLRAPDEPPGGPPAAPPAGAPPAAGPPPGAPPPAAVPPGAPPAAGTPYVPEGLDPTMAGKTDQETIDNLFKSNKGYRDRDATRVVPDNPEAYAAIDADKLLTDLKLDPAVKPHLAGLDKDPIMLAVGKYAMEHKIPAAEVQGIVAIAYAEAQKAGVLEPPVDVAAERTALLPEAAKALPKADQDKAIDARLKQNEDFLNLFAQAGADGQPQLDAKIVDHAKLMLMDTAAGNQFIEFIASKLTGGDRNQPFNAGGRAAGGVTAESLRARRALPENTAGDPKFSQASYDQLDEDYKKFYGDK